MDTQAHADSLVVGCLAGAAAIAAAEAVTSGQAPPARQLVGFTFVAVGLSLGAMFAPGVAGGLAVLVLTTTAFVYGGPLWDTVTSLTSSTPPPSKGHPHS